LTWIGRLSRQKLLAAIVGLLLVWLFPLCLTAVLASQSAENIQKGIFWQTPSFNALLENVATVVFTTPFLEFLRNSLLVTISSVALTLAVSTMSAYAMATNPSKLAAGMLFVLVLGNLVPAPILMIPVRDLMLQLHLYDSRFALVLFHASFQAGFCTFFLYGFIRDLRGDLVEAARLDGASEFAVMLKVVVPAVAPALAALGVVEFTFVWNDFFWSLVLVQSDSARPVTVALQTFKGMYAASWQLLSAAALLTATLPALLFFLMQRYFVLGLTGRPL
jgi:multiple sugar transport system permease protein